jgi:hypothetical protein
LGAAQTGYASATAIGNGIDDIEAIEIGDELATEHRGCSDGDESFATRAHRTHLNPSANSAP